MDLLSKWVRYVVNHLSKRIVDRWEESDDNRKKAEGRMVEVGHMDNQTNNKHGEMKRRKVRRERPQEDCLYTIANYKSLIMGYKSDFRLVFF